MPADMARHIQTSTPTWFPVVWAGSTEWPAVGVLAMRHLCTWAEWSFRRRQTSWAEPESESPCTTLKSVHITMQCPPKWAKRPCTSCPCAPQPSHPHASHMPGDSNSLLPLMLLLLQHLILVRGLRLALLLHLSLPAVHRHLLIFLHRLRHVRRLLTREPRLGQGT